MIKRPWERSSRRSARPIWIRSDSDRQRGVSIESLFLKPPQGADERSQGRQPLGN